MPPTLSSLSAVAKGAYKVFDKYPVTRGMVAYAILWPAGNLLQQTLDGSRSSLDLLELLRYGVYGSCITAPLIHNWIRVLSNFIPGGKLRHALAKGYVDQLVFAPINISQFYLGMALLEGKPLEENLSEWEKKILPTWMISLSIWPILHTLNFTLVPEKNRVMAISLGSFLWMVFLSYMHHTRSDELPERLTTRRIHYDYVSGPREAIGSMVNNQQVLPSPIAKNTPWKFAFQTAHCYHADVSNSAETCKDTKSR
ncbi:PXMP2/4 family protein 4-like [Palaemon carinicauda]|uniref:PXMP2/4 family protein 4-like n=1 Tax=Palaemon carinicauda TaxID=392227 RepID=UPI0035B579EC